MTAVLRRPWSSAALTLLLVAPLVASARVEAFPSPTGERPNLVVSKIAVASSAQVGTAVSAKLQVGNTGTAKAGTSTTKVAWSSNKGLDKHDVVVSSFTTPKLPAGKKGERTLTAAAPATPGTYFLLACADAKGKVKETKEKDNCRAVKVTVTAAPTPPPVVPTASATPTTAPPTTAPPTTAPPTTAPTSTSTASPGGLTLSAVSISPNPIEMGVNDVVDTTLDYSVTVTNSAATASSATTVWFGLIDPDQPTLGDPPGDAYGGASAQVPALAPGATTAVSASGLLLACDGGCDAATWNIAAMACLDAPSGPVGCTDTPVVLTYVGGPCDCWPDGVDFSLTATIDADAPILLADQPVEVPVTVHVVNTTGESSPADVPVRVVGFIGERDPDFGWEPAAGATQPAPLTITVPSLSAGGSADVPATVELPAYDSTTRHATHLWVRLQRPGSTSDKGRVDKALRLDATYHGDEPDFVITPGTLSAPRFHAGVGESDTRTVTFTVGNVGGSDPGDGIGIAVQFNDEPVWDPAAPVQRDDVLDGLSGSRSASLHLTWSGAVPAGATYVVACADTVSAEDAAGYWPHVETSEANNCVSTPASFLDLDGGADPVDGYGTSVPAPDPLDVAVEPFTGTGSGVSGTFGWDRPGDFSWSPTRTDDQVWTLDPAAGVHATITMPWATFIETLDFAAAPVTLTDGDDDVPFGSVLTAVDVTPGDLLAQVPYTLDFTLDASASAGVDQHDLVAFAADSDGSNLRLIPIVANADGGWSADHLRVMLGHFGIVGLAIADPAVRALLSARVPTDNDQQTEAEAAEPTRLQRLAGLGLARGAVLGRMSLTDEPDYVLAWRESMMRRYNGVLVPAFDAASVGGLLDIEVAIQIGAEWLHTVAISGMDQDEVVGPVNDEVSARVNHLRLRHADLVKEECVNGGGFNAFRKMLLELRVLALLGLQYKYDELVEAIGACSSFKASYHQAWADQNTNASLAGGLTSEITLQAPTLPMIKAGSLPNGTAPMDWTSYHATTTDTYDTYDQNGNPVGHCEVTTTDTPVSGSKMTLYVKDYGLTFLRGGGHRSLWVSMWLFGSSTDGDYDHPVVIHRSRVSGCADYEYMNNEWDVTDKPYPGDPAIQVNGQGFRAVKLTWQNGHYEHSWSVTRSGGLHPTQESLEITVDPDPY